MNLYGFANGDPVNFADPFGLMACDPPDDPCPEAAARGALTYAAAEAVWAGAVRADYVNAVGALGASDRAARTALKASARAQTPPMFRSVIDSRRPGLGPSPGSGGTASHTNVGANRLGAASRAAGAVGLGISAASYASDVAGSDNRWRSAFQAVGGLTGAIGGGLLGATLGSGAGPAGAVGGGLGGGALGGAAGEAAGSRLYNWLFGN